jgi:predicted amidophosphoribosyltransferase
MQNLKSSFAVENAGLIKDKNVLLIDDVYTTGATANECSKELLKSGAGKVYVLTVCGTVLLHNVSNNSGQT